MNEVNSRMMASVITCGIHPWGADGFVTVFVVTGPADREPRIEDPLFIVLREWSRVQRGDEQVMDAAIRMAHLVDRDKA